MRRRCLDRAPGYAALGARERLPVVAPDMCRSRSEQAPVDATVDAGARLPVDQVDVLLRFGGEPRYSRMGAAAAQVGILPQITNT
jgi:hypothetical protein